jgi:hypothetical protein
LFILAEKNIRSAGESIAVEILLHPL